MNLIKKIAVIGPESTGKSTLCEQLAKHFNTLWCPEYAREYLNENGVKYSYDDLIKITQGQLKAEDDCEETLKAHPAIGRTKLKTDNSSLITHNSLLLILDTNMCVMKVWYEYVFGKCEYIVLDEIAKRKYDLYLLCNIDLPWTFDAMREYPDEQSRKELYNIYKDLLINQTTPWIEINGNYNRRLKKAVDAVEKYCFV